MHELSANWAGNVKGGGRSYPLLAAKIPFPPPRLLPDGEVSSRMPIVRPVGDVPVEWKDESYQEGKLPASRVSRCVGRRLAIVRSPLRDRRDLPPREVMDCLRRVEHLVESQGLHAAGFVSYEAAPAFDRALAVREAPGFPLLWFGLFPAVETRSGACRIHRLQADCDQPPEGGTPALAAFGHRRRVCRGHRPAPREDRRGRNVPGELHVPPAAAGHERSVDAVRRTSLPPSSRRMPLTSRRPTSPSARHRPSCSSNSKAGGSSRAP